VNTVEDRLRAATRAAASTVADGSAPPLRLPAPGRRTVRPVHPRRRIRWMAPAAAAAAIAAVAAGLVVAAGPAPVTKAHPGPDSSPAALPAVQQAPRLADGLPAYFLAVPEGEVTGRGAASGAVDIVSTATGRTAVKVTLPGSVYRITADSTGAFYAAVLPRRGPVRFYRIAWPVRGSGRAAVTALPIRAPSGGISFLAASPDGARLAMATYVQRGSTEKVQNLTVASTTTGTARHWSTPPADAAGAIAGVSWLADNRTLAFSWAYSFGSARGSVRLLDTAAAGTNLLAGQSVLQLNNPAGKFQDLVISADGRVLIGTAAYPGGPFGVVQGRSTALGDVIRFSARTGMASFLYRPRAPQAPATATFCHDPTWVSASGQQALLSCSSNPPGGRPSVRVLLLGQPGATRLRQLDAMARNDLTAFGS
jgi:hypothetical protein